MYLHLSSIFDSVSFSLDFIFRQTRGSLSSSWRSTIDSARPETLLTRPENFSARRVCCIIEKNYHREIERE